MTNLKIPGWRGPWNAYLYLVIQIYFSLVGLWKNRSAIWWELKQLQTSSSRFLLILPRHQSTFPLIYILLINRGDNIWQSEHIHSYKQTKYPVKSACKLGLLAAAPLVSRPSVWPGCCHTMWWVSLFTSAVRMLTNYFPGIRINYHKLFERARDLHPLEAFRKKRKSLVKIIWYRQYRQSV